MGILTPDERRELDDAVHIVGDGVAVPTQPADLNDWIRRAELRNDEAQRIIQSGEDEDNRS